MTIPDLKLFVRTIWQWTLFNGLAPRGIRPSDSDGKVEVGRRLLVLEGKTGRGDVNAAQRIEQRNLSDVQSTLVLRGSLDENGEPVEITEFQFWPSDDCPIPGYFDWEPFSVEEARLLYEDWCRWSDENPRPR